MRHRSAAIGAPFCQHSQRATRVDLAVFKTVGEKPFEILGLVDVQMRCARFRKSAPAIPAPPPGSYGNVKLS